VISSEATNNNLQELSVGRVELDVIPLWLTLMRSLSPAMMPPHSLHVPAPLYLSGPGSSGVLGVAARK